MLCFLRMILGKKPVLPIMPRFPKEKKKKNIVWWMRGGRILQASRFGRNSLPCKLSKNPSLLLPKDRAFFLIYNLKQSNKRQELSTFLVCPSINILNLSCRDSEKGGEGASQGKQHKENSCSVQSAGPKTTGPRCERIEAVLVAIVVAN